MDHHDVKILIHIFDFMILMLMIHEMTYTWLTSTAVKIIDGNPWERFAEALRQERLFFSVAWGLLFFILLVSDEWMISPIAALMGLMGPLYIDSYLAIRRMRKG